MLTVTDGADRRDDESISDDGPPTPLSQSGDDDTASLKESMKRYQPTVEDYDEDEDDASSSSSSSSEHVFSPEPQDDTDETLSRTSSTDSASSHSSNTTATSVSSSNSPRPTVHFSDKQPPVFLYVPEPPEPEPEPEAEPEPELHRSHSLPSHLRPPVSERHSPAPVDLQWDALFNERNEPTPALGRFLRGLANYIVCPLYQHPLVSQLTLCRSLNTPPSTPSSSPPTSSSSSTRATSSTTNTFPSNVGPLTPLFI